MTRIGEWLPELDQWSTLRVGFSVVFVSYERFATLLNDVDMQKVHIQSAKTSSVVVDYRFMTALFSFVNSS